MNYRAIAERSQASQDWFEFWQLLEIVSKIHPQNILEIGVDKGFACASFREAFPMATIAGIDCTKDNIQVDGFELIVGDSHSFHTAAKAYNYFERHKIDFLFIDGDHNYSGVKKDFDLYGTMVRRGGIIAFHDISRLYGQIPGVEVRQLFDELKEKYPSIEIWNGAIGLNGPGIGVLFKL